MKRLRIVQQIIIVILFAVLVPFITIGLIISNISQQSVRRELNYGATSMAEFVGENIQRYFLSSDNELNYIADSLKYMNQNQIKKYLKEIEKKGKYSDFKIQNKIPDDEFEFDNENQTLKIYSEIDNNKILCANLNGSNFNRALNEKSNLMQYVFIFDDKMRLVASNNSSQSDLKSILKALPKKLKKDEGTLFSQIKNQPLAYYQITKPNWTFVVMSHPEVSINTIDAARVKIILCLLVAAGCILFMVGLYTYYLYINIRQLFKGITAISKGSYDRKIRLLKNIFTPHEIAFLEKEFNYMTQKVSQGYKEISKKNIELKRLNDFRDSLINAISHEFRTPLTSIIGYSSRLMRQDITIDENMKSKSLHIIKQQAQRLSRMVDDLLTVPDIESFHLAINREALDLNRITELCIEWANTKNTEFIIESQKNLNKVMADNDRLIQIITNLCENAVKYNLDEEPIKIVMKNESDCVSFRITNKSHDIPEDTLNKLFDKFIRMENDLTRTTRGTGLGLFIVKGLSDAMNIDIKLISKDEKFTVELKFKDYESL